MDDVNTTIFPGVLDDIRPQDEKENDFDISELITSFAPATWKVKTIAELRTFKIYNQDGSGSCVSQAVRKALGVANFVEEGKYVSLSARYIYTKRSNDSMGMFMPEAMDIARKRGSTLEILCPDDNLGESKMNVTSDIRVSDDQIAQIFKPSNWAYVPKDIEKIASFIQEGKCIVFGFRFDIEEWGVIPVTINNKKVLGHAVAGVDFTILGKENAPDYPQFWGQKAILIEDSWGASSAWNGRRFITQDFIDKHCFFSAYFLELRNDWRDLAIVPTVTKPHYTFLSDLSFESKFTVDEDVKKLQEVLRYDGSFPLTVDGNPVEITGWYGPITRKAVYDFQVKYGVASKAELDMLNGKKVGPATRAKLNEIYGA